jgi:hypothetical protein
VPTPPCLLLAHRVVCCGTKLGPPHILSNDKLELSPAVSIMRTSLAGKARSNNMSLIYRRTRTDQELVGPGPTSDNINDERREGRDEQHHNQRGNHLLASGTILEMSFAF